MLVFIFPWYVVEENRLIGFSSRRCSDGVADLPNFRVSGERDVTRSKCKCTRLSLITIIPRSTFLESMVGNNLELSALSISAPIEDVS